jgi:hypothetical protein
MLSTIENREALVRQKQELMWCTCVHEAAHAVCANWFDPPIPIVSATIEYNPYPRVITGNHAHDDMWGWRGALLTWVAVAAEQQFFYGDPIEAVVLHSHDERMRRFLVAGGFRTDPEAIEFLHGQAAWLVRTPWAQHRIRLVAEALLERGTISGAVVCVLCGDPRDTSASDWVVKPDPRGPCTLPATF